MARGVISAEQNSVSSSWDHSAKINWVEAVKGIMQSSYNRGDLKGYMEFKMLLDLLGAENEYQWSRKCQFLYL